MKISKPEQVGISEPLTAADHTLQIGEEQPFEHTEKPPETAPGVAEIGPTMPTGESVPAFGPSVLSDSEDPALEFVWSQFKLWDISSTRLKQIVYRWQKWVLMLVILSSFTAILSDSVMEWGLPTLARGIIIVSAFSVALCTYAGSQVLNSENENGWVRARAVAETFKSEAYLYQLRAAPYDVDKPEVLLFDRSKAVMKTVSDLSPEVVLADMPREGLVPQDLTFDKYLTERVKDQLTYYQKKTQYFSQLLRRVKNWGFFVGFVGVIMGTISANGWQQVSIWIAFLNSVTASVASFNASRKYEQQFASYRNMAYRITRLLSKSQRIPADDVDAQRAFVVACEAVLTAENKSWIDELSE